MKVIELGTELETVAVPVTEEEAFLIRARCRPFVYRPVGEKEWRLGWALPGVDVHVFLRERLEPSLGVLEIETRPKQCPGEMSEGAWLYEMNQRHLERAAAD